MKLERIPVVLILTLGLVLTSGSALRAEAHAAGVPADQAIEQLKAGNARYMAGQSQHPHNSRQRRAEVAGGQHPFATILACSDSREPVELIFDGGIGDFFVIRVAGNIADTDETATAEYGADHLGTQLLVVLGHTRCGAVTAATQDGAAHGSVAHLLSHIKPAVTQARKQGDADLVARAIRLNIFKTMADLLEHSSILRERIKARKLTVIGAIYDIESGAVQWLGTHPQQEKLIAAPTPQAHEPAHRHDPHTAPGQQAPAPHR